MRPLRGPCQTIPNIGYRWLTAFIFAAEAYNAHACFLEAPPGITCGRKRANEAFIFLALYVPPTIPANSLSIYGPATNKHSIFTFFGMFIEVAALWAYRKEHPAAPAHEKNGAGRAPLDGPAEPAAPAGTV